jgi:hypothetical protein
MRRFLRDNGLSLAFWLLFAATLAGDYLAALALAGEEPATHPGRGWGAPLTSPEFLRGILGNWQAALLQLLTLVVLATFLRQRGAAHSLEPGDEAAREALAEPRSHATPAVVPSFLAKHFPRLYPHSLSIGFVVLFVPTLVGFFLVDLAATNADRVAHHLPRFTATRYLGAARFWFDLLQTWQAEFFAMAVFLVMTIYLREKGSPESKRMDASDRDTGDTNE